MPAVDTEILTSAARTADGNSDAVSIPTATMLALFTDITALSGTGPTLGAWLEWSPDKGTTWFVVPYDLHIRTDATLTAADVSADANKRNATGTSTTHTAGDRHVAIYKHVPAGHVRVNYKIGGTGPSFTFSSRLQGK